MRENLEVDRTSKLAVIGFVLLSTWWVWLQFSGLREDFHNYLFGAVYGVMAAYGGFLGLAIARSWGGFKSVMGRAIIFLSLGLLAAEFGQIVFSYYNIFLGVEIPYPSLADVGFFGNIPLYTLGILSLAKASGIQFSAKKLTSKLLIGVLPAVMLLISYAVFLQGYEIDPTEPLRTFLDFGYPLGQAFYISIALLTYSLSKKTLGGMMKGRILVLLLAFVMQYLADYNFLLQTVQGTWVNGGYGDYLYLVAYFLMALGLLQLRTVAMKVRG